MISVPRILCVEDEPDLLQDMVDELRDAGFRVDRAANGRDALDIVADRTPDLILCDVQMPRMNGLDFKAALARHYPAADAVPFVYMTAFGGRDFEALGDAACAQARLTKPIDYQEMLALVCERLGCAGPNAMPERGMDVLVVEDDPDLAEELVEYLDRAGLSASACSNAASGISLYDQDPARIVATDMRLKSGSGLDVLAAIRANARERGRGPDFIVITGAPQDAEAVIGQPDVIGVVRKPVEIATLTALLQARLSA